MQGARNSPGCQAAVDITLRVYKTLIARLSALFKLDGRCLSPAREPFIAYFSTLKCGIEPPEVPRQH